MSEKPLTKKEHDELRNMPDLDYLFSDRGVELRDRLLLYGADDIEPLRFQGLKPRLNK